MSERAHLVDTEGSQGERQRYWRQFVEDSEGRTIIGIGATQEQAEAAAAKNLADREAFLAQTPQAQLREIVSKSDDLLSSEASRAIKLMAGIVLEYCKP